MMNIEQAEEQRGSGEADGGLLAPSIFARSDGMVVSPQYTAVDTPSDKALSPIEGGEVNVARNLSYASNANNNKNNNSWDRGFVDIAKRIYGDFESDHLSKLPYY